MNDLKCHICDKTFTKPENKKFHVETVHELKKKYVCEFCSLTFTTKGRYKTHVLNIHQKREEFPKCDMCHKVFLYPDSLKKHIAYVHNKEKKHNCKICQKPFSHVGNLNHTWAEGGGVG